MSLSDLCFPLMIALDVVDPVLLVLQCPLDRILDLRRDPVVSNAHVPLCAGLPWQATIIIITMIMVKGESHLRRC